MKNSKLRLALSRVENVASFPGPLNNLGTRLLKVMSCLSITAPSVKFPYSQQYTKFDEITRLPLHCDASSSRQTMKVAKKSYHSPCPLLPPALQPPDGRVGNGGPPTHPAERLWLGRGGQHPLPGWRLQ